MSDEGARPQAHDPLADLRADLARRGDLTPAELVDRLQADQARRWRAGRGVPAEAYLDVHPAARDHPDVIVELILGEVLLRRERGERPDPAEYARRFPEMIEALAGHFELDRLLGAVEDTESVPGPSAYPPANGLAGGETVRDFGDDEVRRELGRGVLDSITASFGPVPRVLLRDSAPGERPSPLVNPSSVEMPEGTNRLQLLGEIARGGMGAVFKGRDRDLGRDLAVKVLLEKHRDSPDLVRRFVEEAQIGGQLQHPGIVPVHELGQCADGRPYFLMKLVKGRTLAEVLKDRADPHSDPSAPVATWLQVCQTMAYSHARGVIHRDLKPSNVMVGSFGEVQVMDWGLAKVLPRGGAVDDATAGTLDASEDAIATDRSRGSERDLSRAGSVMGTPAYMAPEQARGEVDRLDERCDVFALGSILCEVLTNQPAFTGRMSAEVQLKAARGDLADARDRLDACGADAELVSLAKDCLAAEPDDRPRHAGIVAARGLAYQAAVQEKLRKAELDRIEERGRRRLTTVAAAAVLLLGFTGGGGYLWVHQQRAERGARTARAVDDGLTEVARLRGEAQANPASAPTKLAEARSSAKGAEALLAQGEADAPLRDRVAVLLARLDRDQADAAEKVRRLEVDRVLLTDLEAVRSDRVQHFDPKQTDADYAAAFLKAGLDLDATDPAEAGQWLASRSDPAEMAGYIDDWANARRGAGRAEADWRRLVAAARGADPDPWRDALRAKFGSKDAATVAEFRRLADDPALEDQPAAGMLLLARQLKFGGDGQRAAQVLRRAALRHPGDFRIHFELALAPGEAIESYGRLKELYPDPDEAVQHLAAAVAIRPGSVSARVVLGMALNARTKLDEAAATFREAVRLKPDDVNAHTMLGNVLRWQRKYDEAAAEAREAIRLKPDNPRSHDVLAAVLIAQGKYEEAVAEDREAIRLKPDYNLAHDDLLAALRALGRLDEAVVIYREVARLRPDYAMVHYYLGRALYGLGKLDEAVAAYRELLRLKPDDARALCRLGLCLRRQGDYAGALAVLRKGHELGSKQPAWNLSSAQWLAEAEPMAALADRVPALLKGDDHPRDATERLTLARICRDKKRYATAARLCSEALAADPKLGDDLRTNLRYNAAAAAALAGCRKGQDDPPPDDARKAEFRRQALDWLKRDLAMHSQQLATGTAEAREEVARAMASWTKDSDLSGVRNPVALAKLPESERGEWRALWADVEAHRKRAQGPTP